MGDLVKAGALFSLLALSSSVVAQDVPTSFDSLQIDHKDCNLVEQGTRNKGVIWSGKSEIGMCFVVVDRAEFEKRYSHCMLSGILSSKNEGVTCEFGYFNREKTKISFTSGKEALCEFVCIKTASR